MDWQAICMRYRNVESVRMTEQTDREHHNTMEMGANKNMRMLRELVGRVEPSTSQHIATKDAEEKHEEETQNMGFA